MSYNFYQHGGNIEEEAARLGINPGEIIDASASIVPFKCPKSLKKYLQVALSTYQLRSYPDRSHKALREAISNWLKIEPEMIIPGNGASELFTWAARDASEYGISALPAPGFSDYERALNCWNARYIFSPLPLNWEPIFPQDFPILPEAQVLWITNPHNPTGQLWSKKSIEPLLEKYKLIICDEAFLDLVPNGEKESLLPLIKDHQNLIIIKSLTKLFSIAGLRLGYALGNPERLDKWKKLRDPWPVNGLAISAGTKLFTEINELNKWINKIQTWVEEEGSWFYSKLKPIPNIKPLPTSTNFLLIKGQSSLTKIKENLSKKYILTRDCCSFQGLNESYLRISLQQRCENKKIISTLKEIIKLNY